MIAFCAVLLLVFFGQLLIERRVNPRNNILNNVTGLAKSEMVSFTASLSQRVRSIATVLMSGVERFSMNLLRGVFGIIILLSFLGFLVWLLGSLVSVIFRR
jgi:hypothetical protein